MKYYVDYYESLNYKDNYSYKFTMNKILRKLGKLRYMLGSKLEDIYSETELILSKLKESTYLIDYIRISEFALNLDDHLVIELEVQLSRIIKKELKLKLTINRK
jgi:hypothetical protein